MDYRNYTDSHAAEAASMYKIVPLSTSRPQIQITKAEHYIYIYIYIYNIILRFTRCAGLNTIIKMLRTELYTQEAFNIQTI